MKFWYILLFSLLLFNQTLLADTTNKDAVNLKATKVILKYSGDKLEPSILTLKKLDSSVFFLNESQSKEVDLEVDFKDKKMHCHSENLKLINGSLKTERPIKPRDFEILCFPSAGTYAYQVKETGIKGKVLKGEIVISE